MTARLKVLYLTHHGPWPASSGGRLRDAALIPRLAELVELEVWAVSRTPLDDQTALAQWVGEPRFRIYADEGSIRRFPTRHSEKLREDLQLRSNSDQRFDLIHVEGHYLAHLVPESMMTRTIVVEHNVESSLLSQRIAAQGAGEELLDDLAEVREVEERTWTRVSMVVTLSAEDRARVLERVPSALVELSTDGADHIPLRSRTFDYTGQRPFTVGYLANYQYPPNRDALQWILSDLFPRIREQIPDCELVLAGSNLDRAVAELVLSEGVRPQGWLDDLSLFWDQIDLFTCPLRIGGGIKVKMIEAFRSGAPTVSTSLGVEGLPPSARSAAVVADGSDNFVNAVVNMSMNRDFYAEKQAATLKAQSDFPSWEDVALDLVNTWHKII